MSCPRCQAANPDSAITCAQCGLSLVPVTGLQAGAVVAGRYHIESVLGKGGMGMVFRAHDRVLEETVALKLLRAEVAADPDIARRFRQEIKLARRVRHRNVCGIHEYGESGELRWIAMELIEGVDLRRVLQERGAPPVEEAFEISVQVCEGLQAIHEAGIIHRDLKTPNIMRDGRGVVRLMDFGIAKQAGSEATLSGTAFGMIVGTPEYMSPEQARGEKIDFRSDIYALGVVIFEIFTGHVPFRGETPIATIFKHLQEPPPLEGPAAAGVPPVLVPLLRKALAKIPAERYDSVRDLTVDLQEARAGGRAAGVPSTVRLPGAAVPKLQPLPVPSAPTPIPTHVPTEVRTVVQPPSATVKEAAAAQVLERERVERERAEKAQAEKARAEREREERERAEQEKRQREAAEREKAERERLERERAERERAQKTQAEKAQAEKAQAEKARAERERAERERAEQERRQREAAEREKAERERAEREKAEKAERERVEAERRRAVAVAGVSAEVDRLTQAGNFDEAERVLAAARRAQGDLEPFAGLAVRVQNARREARTRAIEQLLHRATQASAARRYEDALESVRKALELDPQNARLHAERTRLEALRQQAQAKPPEPAPATPAKASVPVVAPTPRVASPRRTSLYVAGGAGLAALTALGLWAALGGGGKVDPPPATLTDDRPSPEPVLRPSAGPVLGPSPAPNANTGLLVIDAVPWGEVTEVRGGDGRAQELANRYTPVVLRLPPGEYLVSVRNPAFPKPMTAQARVEAARVQTERLEFRRVDVAEYFKKTGW